MSLVGGKVLVTGATGGIGHAIARAFAARGATLTLTGRRAEVLEPLARELGARAVICDLAQGEDVDRLAREAGDLDVLVANAALPGSGALLGYTPEQVDRTLDVNFRAPIGLTRALAPAMVSRGRGHIVFITSLQSKAATPGAPLYCATKFGLRGFALSLRQDLRAAGVGVSLVAPGFISDAGLFADSGATLPIGIGTRSPEQVATAVIRAIERNRTEIEVAPASLRIAAAIAGLAPQISATVSRLLGSEQIAAQVGAGQLDKR